MTHRVVEKIIFSGSGGQGIMFASRVLAHAKIEDGFNICWTAAYGAQVRGGASHAMLTVGKGDIGCPLIEEATCLIAMNSLALSKFIERLEVGGLLIYDSSIINRTDLIAKAPKSVQICNVDATSLAQTAGLGSQRANMVLVGAYVACWAGNTRSSIEGGLVEVLGNTKRHLLDVNLKAFDMGYAKAQEIIASGTSTFRP